MIKKKIWLIGVSVVTIAFSVNAFAMMSGNNGYSNHSQGNGYSSSHMSDYDKGLHHRDSYGVPWSDFDNSINRNHNDSQESDYNRGYQRNYQGPNKNNNFRGNPNRNINPNRDRYREDYRFQRYDGN